MIDIRPAAEEELPAVAQLRWQWVLDTPAYERAGFVTSPHSLQVRPR